MPAGWYKLWLARLLLDRLRAWCYSEGIELPCAYTPGGIVGKHYGLQKRTFPRIHREYHDVAEYAHTLPPEAQEWLARYMDETLASRFRNDGEDFFPETEKNEIRQREIYNPSNARRRDAYGLAKAGFALLKKDGKRKLHRHLGMGRPLVSSLTEPVHRTFEEESENITLVQDVLGCESPEDALIAAIDLKRALEDDENG